MQIIMLYVRVVGVNSKDRYLILKSPDPSILYTYVCVLNMKNMYVYRGIKTKLTYLIKL
jgi:hypothetical protein